MDNEKFILLTLEENIEVLEKTKSTLSKDIMGLINEFEETFERGNKVFVFGNGGCAGVAQQMASAFIGRFKSGKPSRPVISLSSDASLITALCNDYGFENIYKKQVEAYVKEGDLVIGLTASGNSLNVLNAVEKAKEIGAKTLGITGESGGKLKDICHCIIRIPSGNPTFIEDIMAEINSILCKTID